MKILSKVSFVLLASMFLLISCEKENIQVDDEEGLKSKTGDQVESIDPSAKLIESEIILHKTYGENLTAEQAQVKWIEDLKNFELTQGLKGFSSNWYTTVSTHTGDQYHNDTDAEVYIYINVTTNNGSAYIKKELNNKGDDREKDQWDFYVLRCYVYKETYEWVKLTNAKLRHKGTDGWFVTHFNVGLNPSDQTVTATGGCYIYTEPNIWMDNRTSSGVDYFYTPNYEGTGRLEF